MHTDLAARVGFIYVTENEDGLVRIKLNLPKDLFTDVMCALFIVIHFYSVISVQEYVL